MRFANLGAVPLVAVGLLAVWCQAAEPAPNETAAPAPDKALIVHEWGTFSTFSGSNGTNLQFQPYDNDLPEFVHGYLVRNSKAGPRGGSISLETPVIYFYSERPLTVSVRVDFPKGILTEWFPYAARTDHQLNWKEVQVASKEEATLPEDKKPSRYYAARETDAAPLRVAAHKEAERTVEQGRLVVKEAEWTTEQEKFLFYRGVGTFDLPLSVKASAGGKCSVGWKGKVPEGDLILVQVKAGKIRFRQFGLERKDRGGAGAEVQVPEVDATAKELGDALVKLLVAKGLFEKEAQAMVKTWSSAWFGEEGTRVLYLLPTDLTDELLPLKVEPKPDALTRVLVGRHDVLTPEREKQIDALVTQHREAAPLPEATRRVAANELAKLGRYLEAAEEESMKRLENKR